MRGSVYIERENTEGDRAIVHTLDVEGFSSTVGDPMEVIKRAATKVLIESGAYTVRAIHDTGWNTRVIYIRSFGDSDRPTMAVLAAEASEPEQHPMLGDLDITIWTVRDDSGEVIAEFRDEDEALAYGSHLANANPDECYSVVAGRWNPIPPWQTPKAVA